MSVIRYKTSHFLITLAVLACFTTTSSAQNVLVKSGEKIAFLGDSITA